MDTLNLISKRVLYICVFFSILAQQCLALTNEQIAKSMFPCVPGTYWITQDTFFTGEAEQIVSEDLGLDAKQITLDSIKELVNYQNGKLVKVIRKRGVNKNPGIIYELFFDTAGVVYDVTKNEMQLTIGLPLWRMYPAQGDTVYEGNGKNRPLVYGAIHADSTIAISPKWKSKNSRPNYIFKQGIGLIGQIYPTTATRLIEYRIGNGPIVKKRWLMKKPEVQ